MSNQHTGIPLRVAALGDVAEHLRPFYGPTGRGDFALQTTNKPAPEPEPDEKKSQQQRREALKRQLVSRALKQWGVLPDAVDKVTQWVESSIRVDTDADGNDYIQPLVDGTSWRLPSSLEGKDIADVDEFLARNALASKHPEYFAKTAADVQAEVKAEDDKRVEHVAPPPSRLVLRHGYTQAEFEAAHQRAAETGAEIHIAGDPMKTQPIRQQTSAADVPLPPNYSQEQFEQAVAKASEQGGEVVLPD